MGNQTRSKSLFPSSTSPDRIGEDPGGVLSSSTAASKRLNGSRTQIPYASPFPFRKLGRPLREGERQLLTVLAGEYVSLFFCLAQSLTRRCLSKQFHHRASHGKEERMATGRFGKETYKSEQGVRAHMRGCTQYRKSKKLPALGCILQAGSTPSDQPPTSIEPDCVAPLREFEKTMHEFSTTQEAPQTPAAIASVNPPGGEGTGRRSVSLIVWDCDVDEAWRRENGERAAVCCLYSTSASRGTRQAIQISVGGLTCAHGLEPRRGIVE